MRGLVRAIVLAWGVGWVPAAPGGWEWAGPTRVAIAECSRFPWVSDLPMVPETARLLECASGALGSPHGKAMRWSDGSSEGFVRWLDALARDGDPSGTLILYFSTHQRADGRMRFSEGPDLAASALVASLNALGGAHARVLFLNDTCHAAAIERAGAFRESVVRLHACRENERAADVVFSSGPFGAGAFARGPRTFLRDRAGLDPEGMSLLGLFGLAAGIEVERGKADTVDLRRLFAAMLAARDAWDRNVRQARAQHLELAPPDANFEIARRRP